MTEIKKVITSKRYTLNWRDISKGLIVAVGSSVVAACQTALDPNTLHFNWRFVVGSGIAGAVAYLGKNFFESSKVIIETKEADANN